jgi:hypothetical protein
MCNSWDDNIGRPDEAKRVQKVPQPQRFGIDATEAEVLLSEGRVLQSSAGFESGFGPKQAVEDELNTIRLGGLVDVLR